MTLDEFRATRERTTGDVLADRLETDRDCFAESPDVYAYAGTCWITILGPDSYRLELFGDYTDATGDDGLARLEAELFDFLDAEMRGVAGAEGAV